MVEMLRPAPRHSAENESETARFVHVGAPMAPFLTQLIAQGQDVALTAAEASHRYDATTLLAAAPQCVPVATL